MLKRLNFGRGETIEVKVRGLGIPILLRRSARARRFSLQVSEARRGAVLTMPVYSSFADADEFLSRHLDWLKERVAGLSEPVPFTHGAIVPLRGYAHTLRFAGSVRRRGVVWIEEPEDAKAAPAWPEGAHVSVRRLPRLYVVGRRGACAAPAARLAEAPGASRSQDSRRAACAPPRSLAEAHLCARPDHALGLVLDERSAVLLLAARARAAFRARLSRRARGRSSRPHESRAALLGAGRAHHAAARGGEDAGSGSMARACTATAPTGCSPPRPATRRSAASNNPSPHGGEGG